MGRDKAAMVHRDGRSLAARGLDLLGEAGCDEVFLSLAEGQELPGGVAERVAGGVEVVRDEDGRVGGPLAGIHAAMRRRPEAAWLVVACDLPRLEVGVLRRLVDDWRADPGCVAYRSEHDGLPEPLCAVYPAGASEWVEEAVERGHAWPRKILMEHGCRVIEAATGGALANTNTPEEWREAMGELEEAGAWPSAVLSEIWISGGNDFRGRHGIGRLHHGVQRVAQVEAVAGMGLRGDRYFGYKENYKGQVTFFDAATVAAVQDLFSVPELSAAAFRRNLVVSGVDLSEWLGREFEFQGIRFVGAEECKPCYWMDEAVAPGVEAFLKDGFRGGLRARILTDGVLRAS